MNGQAAILVQGSLRVQLILLVVSKGTKIGGCFKWRTYCYGFVFYDIKFVGVIFMKMY